MGGLANFLDYPGLRGPPWLRFWKGIFSNSNIQRKSSQNAIIFKYFQVNIIRKKEAIQKEEFVNLLFKFQKVLR